MGKWLFSLNEEKYPTNSLQELQSLLVSASENASGTIWLESDGGRRSRWGTFFTGLAPQIYIPHFFLAWYGHHAALIFHDEDWSEYRAVDPIYPTNPSNDIRASIMPPDVVCVQECLLKTRAFAAAREYLIKGERPTWMKYRYVR